MTGASAPRDEYPPEDPPPWMAELLHAPDPNVRIQALDALASQPSVSLDPLTYALVDSDESVRTRAQELLEEALARVEPPRKRTRAAHVTKSEQHSSTREEEGQ